MGAQSARESLATRGQHVLECGSPRGHEGEVSSANRSLLRVQCARRLGLYRIFLKVVHLEKVLRAEAIVEARKIFAFGYEPVEPCKESEPTQEESRLGLGDLVDVLHLLIERVDGRSC